MDWVVVPECSNKCDDAKKWDPIKIDQDARIEVFVVGEDAEAGERERHEDGAEDEKWQSAEVIAQNSGSDRSNQLNDSSDDCGQMWIEWSDESVTKDGHRVEVESDDAGKSRKIKNKFIFI